MQQLAVISSQQAPASEHTNEKPSPVLAAEPGTGGLDWLAFTLRNKPPGRRGHNHFTEEGSRARGGELTGLSQVGCPGKDTLRRR